MDRKNKYEVIQSFKGSPDGRFTISYTKGDKDIDLSESLAAVAIAEGWVKPMQEEAQNPKPRRKRTSSKIGR
ncbi:MAG: hypothetical protein JAY90_18505 [Candidatus Thiodiazotropha lotti]|nr:hypothetical protein [Candidatus Thiodiazotropha lotti]